MSKKYKEKQWSELIYKGLSKKRPDCKHSFKHFDILDFKNDDIYDAMLCDKCGFILFK